MAAIELYKADGTTAGVFYCSQCRIIHHTQEQADWCHGERLCACGKKIEQGYRVRICRDCDALEWKEKTRQQEAERFEAATKVPASEYTGNHVCDCDKFYDSVEEAIDQYLEGQKPEYVWGCQPRKLPYIDLEDVTSNLLDNMWEDADLSDLNGIEELEVALKAFNEANESLNMWEVDYSTAVLVGAPKPSQAQQTPPHKPL